MEAGELSSGSISWWIWMRRTMPVQQPRQEEHLADQGQPGDPVDVRGVVEVGDDRGDGGQHERLQREEPDVGEQHPLHHHQQLDDQHPGGQQGDPLRGKFGRAEGS